MLMMIGVTLIIEEMELLQGRVRSFTIMFLLSIVNIVIMLTIFPLQPWGVFFSVFLNELVFAWRRYIVYEIVNNLPLHGVAGMYLTTFTSLNEFSEIKTLHS